MHRDAGSYSTVHRMALEHVALHEKTLPANRSVKPVSALCMHARARRACPVPARPVRLMPGCPLGHNTLGSHGMLPFRPLWSLSACPRSFPSPLALLALLSFPPLLPLILCPPSRASPLRCSVRAMVDRARKNTVSGGPVGGLQGGAKVRMLFARGNGPFLLGASSLIFPKNHHLAVYRYAYCLSRDMPCVLRA